MAVLLRGVNVGGHRRVPMKEWAARLAALGCTDVTTHLQSGQAVLTSALSAADLAHVVREDLADGLAVDTAVLVRTHAQLRAVVDGCPWPEVAEAAPTTVHAAFLDTPPTGWVVDEPGRYAPEEVVVGDGVLYLHFPQGQGKARMPPIKDATARNWRTVAALLELTGS